MWYCVRARPWAAGMGCTRIGDVVQRPGLVPCRVPSARPVIVSTRVCVPLGVTAARRLRPSGLGLAVSFRPLHRARVPRPRVLALRQASRPPRRQSSHPAPLGRSGRPAGPAHLLSLVSGLWATGCSPSAHHFPRGPMMLLLGAPRRPPPASRPSRGSFRSGGSVTSAQV